jgi:hypothetical protein
VADAEFEIAMPPHDDGSYVHARPRWPQSRTPQADLIAMRHNYRMELVTASDGWVEVEFIQNGEIVQDA